MEHKYELESQQTFESVSTPDVHYEWKLQTGQEAPLNAFGLIVTDDRNRKTPVLYELLNPVSAPPAREELTQGFKLQPAAWPEAMNAVAPENLPGVTERHAFLYKTQG